MTEGLHSLEFLWSQMVAVPCNWGLHSLEIPWPQAVAAPCSGPVSGVGAILSVTPSPDTERQFLALSLPGNTQASVLDPCFISPSSLSSKGNSHPYEAENGVGPPGGLSKALSAGKLDLMGQCT